MRHLQTFGRGFALVALTAANVSMIAAGRTSGAFLCGFAISWVWWGNARGSVVGDGPWLRECYALGAAAGTVFGMWLTR